MKRGKMLPIKNRPPVVYCQHCGQDANPHRLWRFDFLHVAWLVLEDDIRGVLKNTTTSAEAKVGRINDALAAHTRRGFAIDVCGNCGRSDF